MNVLAKTASALGRRDEKPNHDVARLLAEKKDTRGIADIVKGVRNPNPALAGDCVEVLSEIGNITPSLLGPHVNELITLLQSHNNRLVWGGMSALTSVAALKAAEIFERIDTVLKAFRTGSVITVDRGVSVLARVCASDRRREKVLWPVLMEHLSSCRPKDLPQHAERVVEAVKLHNAGEMVDMLEKRLYQLSDTQGRRVRKVIDKVKNTT